MRTVYVIGIGAGDPEHLTLAAVTAMNRAQVFFTIDKGDAKGDLAALRTELLARHVRGPYRVVEARDPERDRTAATGRYAEAVTAWQDRREAIYERMIADELGADGAGAFLVWGDPALYDGTLRILDRVRERGAVAFDVVSVPGISSVQALAARHGLVLNRVGRPFVVTTGRRLADEGFPPGVDDAVVMLDAAGAFAGLTDTDLDIYWGAYVGTADEVLVRGDLQEVKASIVALRAEHRARKGWIMDTYLLRRRGVNVLVLGGTGEARRLAATLHGRPGFAVTSSLAGRVATPALPDGEVRIGRFGGVDGLVAWLRGRRTDAVVDATHPFAERMTAHAVAAATALGVPLLLLRRPGWQEGPGDRWHRVPDGPAAAALLPALGERVFLATGRAGLPVFAALEGHWFLLRAIDPLPPPLPPHHHVVLARGPFTTDAERALLREHRIDVLVTRDSGGDLTAAKLVAARELGLPVVLLTRPPAPAAAVMDAVATAESVPEAVRWLERRRS